jgi:hypothetical protein
MTLVLLLAKVVINAIINIDLESCSTNLANMEAMKKTLLGSTQS